MEKEEEEEEQTGILHTQANKFSNEIYSKPAGICLQKPIFIHFSTPFIDRIHMHHFFFLNASFLSHFFFVST